MITITYKGKTYKIPESEKEEILEEYINHWFKMGFLEEVKENKYSSIEKLREELGRRIEEYPNKNCANIANMYVVQELEKFRDFLTSLETKEELRDEEWFTKEAGDRLLKDSNDPENTITGVFDNSKDLIDNLNKISWSPTPWQMIEVSDNKIEWYPAKYEGVSKDKDYPISTKNNQWWYKYARPLQTDKIEELSEWDYGKILDEIVSSKPYDSHEQWILDRMWEQLELLTKTLNQVIRKLK